MDKMINPAEFLPPARRPLSLPTRPTSNNDSKKETIDTTVKNLPLLNNIQEIKPQDVTEESKEKVDKIKELEQLVTQIKENEEKRFKERFGKAWWGKLNHWLNTTEKGKITKMSAKIILGGAAVASATLLSGGSAIYLAPLIYGLGSRNLIDGGIEAIHHFAGGGRNRLKMEAQKQNTLIGYKIEAQKKLENKEIGLEPDKLVFNREDILNNLIKQIKDSEEAIIDLAVKEKRARKERAIISSVLTIGLGAFNGIPLGLHDFSKADAAHQVIWSWHKGLEFIYNSGEKLAQNPSFNLLGLTHKMGAVGTTFVPNELKYGPATAIIGAFLKEGSRLAQKITWPKLKKTEKLEKKEEQKSLPKVSSRKALTDQLQKQEKYSGVKNLTNLTIDETINNLAIALAYHVAKEGATEENHQKYLALHKQTIDWLGKTKKNSDKSLFDFYSINKTNSLLTNFMKNWDSFTAYIEEVQQKHTTKEETGNTMKNETITRTQLPDNLVVNSKPQDAEIQYKQYWQEIEQDKKWDAERKSFYKKMLVNYIVIYDIYASNWDASYPAMVEEIYKNYIAQFQPKNINYKQFAEIFFSQETKNYFLNKRLSLWPKTGIISIDLFARMSLEHNQVNSQLIRDGFADLQDMIKKDLQKVSDFDQENQEKNKQKYLIGFQKLRAKGIISEKQAESLIDLLK